MKKTVHGGDTSSDVAVPHITPKTPPWAAKLRRPAWIEAAIRRSPQAVANEGIPDTPPTESTPPSPHVGWGGFIAILSDLIGLLLALWMLFLMWSYAS